MSISILLATASDGVTLALVALLILFLLVVAAIALFLFIKPARKDPSKDSVEPEDTADQPSLKESEEGAEDKNE